MAASIEVRIDEPVTMDLIGRVRNLGEDVYRALESRASVDLDEIDSAHDRFVVRQIRKRDIGSVTEILKRLARRHGFEESVRLVRQDRS